jgi:hypothetical protein
LLQSAFNASFLSALARKPHPWPLAVGELDTSTQGGFGRHHALRGIGVAGRIAAYCARAQRGSEKVQVGTPSFRIFSAFSGSFSCCH